MLVSRQARNWHFQLFTVKRISPAHSSVRRCLSSIIERDAPLRVLFCGSDDFSITCLKALHQYAASDNSNIVSIDVATKTDKRTGRGLKVLKPPPIKPVAQSLGLRLHQFDTFRGWHLPQFDEEPLNINLIIAVSFGLFVPPRILTACRYGGVNVHPSMLPDLKGSAPIEHALLNGYQKTGVTVQTLHPAKFDEGRVLAQTPQPGLHIPNERHITAKKLKDLLAPIGAEMLVNVLRGRIYLREGAAQEHPKNDSLQFAPKINTDMKQVRLATDTAQDIMRKNRAIPKLWLMARDDQDKVQRIVVGEQIEKIDTSELPDEVSTWLKQQKPGLAFTTKNSLIFDNHVLFIYTRDSQLLAASRVTVSGLREGPAAENVMRAKLLMPPQDVLSMFSILRSVSVP